MNKKQFLTQLNQHSTQFNLPQLTQLLRYNDKRKTNRRIKFITFKLDYLPVIESFITELKQQNMDVEFYDGRNHIYRHIGILIWVKL